MGTFAPDSVKRLVDRFDQNRDAYVSGGYNETSSAGSSSTRSSKPWAGT